VVTKDVPAYAQIAGIPGRITGWRGEAGDLLVFDEHGFAEDSRGFRYEQISPEEVRRMPGY
jgi:serine acetyltransferase